MNIQENVSLANYTTFKVGGPARYFCNVETIEELRMARDFANSKNCPIFVLGAGSNVIASTPGFDGLAIRINFNSVEVDGRVIRAGSGSQMYDLVDTAVTAGLAGLEWAGGLPGTFGGAIRGNAGAFKGEIKDTIQFVTAFSTATGEIKIFDNPACEFEYRESYFKRHPVWVILMQSCCWILATPNNYDQSLTNISSFVRTDTRSSILTLGRCSRIFPSRRSQQQQWSYLKTL